MKAAILIGHGSKIKGFDAPLKKVRAALSKERKYSRISIAYLDINTPSIPAAIDAAVLSGASEIYLLPYFLLAGKHVNLHIPHIASQARKKYAKKAKIVLCPYLGFHKKLVDVVKERLKCR